MSGKTTGKMTRRALRESIFKLVYISEFNTKEEMEEQVQLYFDNVIDDAKDQLKAAPSKEDIDYIYSKYDDIRAKEKEIDEILNRASQGWKTSRMSRVDLSILRVAVYEINYDDDIPVSVAINEAVEIAKKYGGEDSGAFINGILGKAVKEKRD